MKKTINGVFVVEGLHDKHLIESFYDTDYVITNGFDISDVDVLYLNSLPKNIHKFILTDSDDSGIKIRKKLHTLLNEYEDIIFDIEKCNKKHKHGVAEVSTNYMQLMLDKYVSKKRANNKLSKQNLIDLGIISSLNSNDICSKIVSIYHLGNCNKNGILKRLEYMGIEYTELKRTISKL